MLKDFKKAGGAGKVIRQERQGSGAMLPSARPEMRVHDIALSQLDANPLQPRRFFAMQELESLAESLRLRGLKQPIVVRPQANSDRFTVIAGERRWRAAALCGWEKIRAVWSLEDDDGLDGLLENLQRQDLLPLEIADQMVRLRDQQGISMRDIALVTGYREDEASRLAKIATLPDSIRNAYFDSPQGRNIAAGALYEVAMATDPTQQQTLWKMAKKGAAVAALRAHRKAEHRQSPTQPPLQHTLQRNISTLRRHLVKLQAPNASSRAPLDPESYAQLQALSEEIHHLLAQNTDNQK
jgi:ParB/RepB/Spo0J family partition protein